MGESKIYKTERLLNVKQVAEWLNVKESTVYSWVFQRYIPFKKIGRLVRFNEKEVLAWVDANSCKGREGYTPDVSLSKLI